MSQPSVTNCPIAFFHVSCTLWAVRPRVSRQSGDAFRFSPIMSILIQAVIAAGSHLFPSRTEKLSPLAPMVLHTRGRVGSRHFFRRSPSMSNWMLGDFAFIASGVPPPLRLPSSTSVPRFAHPLAQAERCTPPHHRQLSIAVLQRPLPIPNREVKPACADGTAHPWESR